MSSFWNEHFCLAADGNEIEFYLNDHGEIFVHSLETDLFWFTINKEDWKSLKEFIDSQFK